MTWRSSHEKVDVAWQCISERLWKPPVGRYGGFFEERYKEAYDDKAYHDGFGCTDEVCANSQGEKGKCTVPKRLEKYGWWKCQLSNTHISPRTHALIIDNSQSNQEVHKETSTPRRSVWGFGYPCASSTHGT